ncbi:MAG: MBL fold metallo-hydrolase [Acidobacteriota bacterium]|nr:MBL fold metallo-hydrolase [Acidobacteriota bacterium]
MIIETFITSPFQQNTRVLACAETGVAVCVDPGDASPEIAEYIKSSNLELQAITITHAHLDHIGGVADLHKQFPQAEIILHKDDEELYYGLPEQPLFMGIEPHQLKELGLDFDVPPPVSRNWRDGEIYAVGKLNFKISHTPGHAPGHIVLVEETEKKVFGGDCLFAGSIGRTDLPGGNYEQLINAIVEKILPLGDDFTVYTGHGSDTTIGRERTTNPFLAGIL